MKLIARSINWKAEGMKPKNRQPHVFPPPDDGREWMLLEEAAKLYGIKPHTMMIKANELDFTRTFHRGVKTWLLKSEVMHYLAFLKTVNAGTKNTVLNAGSRKSVHSWEKVTRICSAFS